MPSLEQLDQAVREFISENPTDEVTVVVDASFGHRIDPSEVAAFEAAEEAGEVVSPPAGAIGRGDAFLLRIAEKIGATVLSNDSFQEFHGEHTWLFEKGRLIGGKPVPGVGWIFMDRSPVRGAKSREVVKEAKRRKRAEGEEATGGLKGAGEKPGRARPKVVDRAIARATQEVVEPKAESGGGKSRRRRGGAPPAEPVNEPLAFITFIAAHPLGNEVVGSVVEYSSHGAFVDADGARCYVPLSAMADPPPRKAREVVAKGESLTFVVQAFDPQRRGIELALPGFAHLAGAPTPETVEAEIRGETKPSGPKTGRRRGGRSAGEETAGAEVAAGEAAPPRRGRRTAAEVAEAAGLAEPTPSGVAGEEAGPAEPAGKAAPARRRAPARRAPTPPVGEPVPASGAQEERAAPAEELPAPVRRVGPRRSPARTGAMLAPAGPVPPASTPAAVPAGAGAEEAPAPEKVPARKTAARRAPARVTGQPAEEAEGAAPAPAAKKAPARKAPARKAAAEEAPAKKAPARKAPARKLAAGEAPAAEAGSAEAPAGKAPARKAPARKAAAKVAAGVPEEEAPAKKAPAKKAPARKAAAKAAAPGAEEAPARKAAAEKAPARKPAAEKAPAKKAPAKKTVARKAPAAKAAAGGGETDGRGPGEDTSPPGPRRSGRRSG